MPLNYLTKARNLAESAVVTASSEDVNFPGANAAALPISKPWKSADGVTTGVKLLFDLESQQEVSMLALVNHNLRLGSTLTVRAGSSSDPDGSEFNTTLDYRPKLSWKILSPSEMWRYWSFQLNDSGNPDDHVRAGYAMLGVSIALPKTVTPEWTLTPQRVIRRVDNDFGTAMVGANVSEGHLISAAFGPMSIADRNTIRDFLDGLQLGIVPLLIVLNPSDTEAYFVRLLEGWSMVTLPPDYTIIEGLAFESDKFGLVTA